MIKRETYMSRIRPFIGNDLIKVLTGIRRGGKSVMLTLIQEELLEKGVSASRFIALNFEDMNNARFCTAGALHEEISRRIVQIDGKAYLFLDEIQEVDEWEKCVNSFRVEYDCDIKYFEEAFLFYRVRRQDLQGKKLLAVNEKYYVADHGIREAVYGGNTQNINLILENIVCMELLRRGYGVTTGKAGAREIDFICGKKNEKLYVQVSYLLASEDTIAREFGAYDSIRDNYPKYVISLDEFDMSRNGVRHENIRDFLLRDW